MPQAICILEPSKSRDVFLKLAQDAIEFRMILWTIGKRKDEAERGEGVSASPRCVFRSGRVPVKAVGPQIQLLHNIHVARRYVAVLGVSSQL